MVLKLQLPAAHRSKSVGVVCITHNEHVDELVDSWLAQEAFFTPGIDFVVVEGGTTDPDILEHNRDFCLSHGIKRRWVPRREHHTRSDARNYGASHVSGEYLLFVDGDCRPENKDVLARIQQYATKNAVMNFYVAFETNATNGQPPLLGDHREPWMTQGAAPQVTYDLWMMHEQAFMVHRSYFDGVSGFDVSWANSGFCYEGIEMYTRMYAKYRIPLLLYGDVTFLHRWHEKDPDARKTRENLEPLYHRLIHQTFGLEHRSEPNMQTMLRVLRGSGPERYDIR